MVVTPYLNIYSTMFVTAYKHTYKKIQHTIDSIEHGVPEHTA